MDNRIQILGRLYDRFNARDIDAVLSALSDDVAWANAMDGDHVHGLEAVRAYWIQQWIIVSPHVEPLRFRRTETGAVVVEVRQTVDNVANAAAPARMHGLNSAHLRHVFRFHKGKITHFDIEAH